MDRNIKIGLGIAAASGLGLLGYFVWRNRQTRLPGQARPMPGAQTTAGSGGTPLWQTAQDKMAWLAGQGRTSGSTQVQESEETDEEALQSGSAASVGTSETETTAAGSGLYGGARQFWDNIPWE
jgi:hypothetical protein